MSYIQQGVSVAVTLENDSYSGEPSMQTAYVEYKKKRRGFICDDHDTSWCDHIEKMIKENLDVSAMAALIAQSDGNEFEVAIPILPTAGFYQFMIFRPIGLGVKTGWNAAEVFLVREPEPDTEFLLFAEGDSLMSVRSSFVDWFSTQVLSDKPKLICKSSSHKMAAESAWRESMKKGGSAALSEFLCIWGTKKCTFCLSHISVPDSWDNDLIPDPGGQGRWR